MEEGWDTEVEARLESLRCRMCQGANPYVCACAKRAWVTSRQRQRDEEQRKRARAELTVDEKWLYFKALAFPSDTRRCDVCTTGEMRAFCECAKKEWIKNGGMNLL